MAGEKEGRGRAGRCDPPSTALHLLSLGTTEKGPSACCRVYLPLVPRS